MDLSAAYDTVNHRRLLSKVLEMTGDVQLTDLIRTMLENRRIFVVLNGKKSRWLRQRNGLLQGSVMAPMLFNIQCTPTTSPYTRRYSQIHLPRRLVHCIARKRLQQHRSVTHLCPEHYIYDHLTTARNNCVRTLQRHRCVLNSTQGTEKPNENRM